MLKLKKLGSLLAIGLLGSVPVLSLPQSAQASCKWWEVWCNPPIPGTSSTPAPPPSPPATGFTVCNKSSVPKVYVALATKKLENSRFGFNTKIESNGWYAISSGSCQKVYFGKASDVAAVHGTGNGLVWGDGQQFCVHPTNQFSYGNNENFSIADCRSRGGQMVQFYRTDNSNNEYQFSLK